MQFGAGLVAVRGLRDTGDLAIMFRRSRTRVQEDGRFVRSQAFLVYRMARLRWDIRRNCAGEETPFQQLWRSNIRYVITESGSYFNVHDGVGCWEGMLVANWLHLCHYPTPIGYSDAWFYIHCLHESIYAWHHFVKAVTCKWTICFFSCRLFYSAIRNTSSYYSFKVCQWCIYTQRFCSVPSSRLC